MKKIKIKKKRKFKFRLIAYAFIMFLGYELTFNIIMNIKLVNSNEDFLKALIADSNYHLLYEKKASDIFTKLFSKILDVNKPVSILENILHFTPNEENMTYVSNPKLDEVEKLEVNPTVFIYNTHQTEAYQGKALEGYNITPGVMMASYILQDKLAQINIKASVMEDNITDYLNLNNMKYSKSYEASRIFLKDALNKYPNYKLIIDLHRDAFTAETPAATVSVEGKTCAKYSYVVGNLAATYKDNLAFISALNETAAADYSGYTGKVMERGYRYNQELSSKSLLLEIGYNRNQIEEARNAAEIFGKILADTLKSELKE